MKKFLLGNFMVILLVGILFSTGCKEPEPAAPPPMSPTVLILEDPFTFLGMCEEFNDGPHYNMDLTISVIGYTGDPNSPVTSMDTQYETIRNNQNWIEDNPIEIEIPESGTFIVEVLISGLPPCFNCCYKDARANCNGTDNGRPRWSGTAAEVNAVPPPSRVRVENIQLDECTHCGC